jgi:hypothetical protein
VGAIAHLGTNVVRLLLLIGEVPPQLTSGLGNNSNLVAVLLWELGLDLKRGEWNGNMGNGIETMGVGIQSRPVE